MVYCVVFCPTTVRYNVQFYICPDRLCQTFWKGGSKFRSDVVHAFFWENGMDFTFSLRDNIS